MSLVATNAKILSPSPYSTWNTYARMLIMPTLQNAPLAGSTFVRNSINVTSMFLSTGNIRQLLKSFQQ
jgi:hypothetical protein